jgi:uncharacterized protein
MATAAADRILSLDVIRGIAVMGIFSVNVVGMAMIESAYFNPPDYGFSGLGDRIMWAANFVLVDGKFRSLFSILFGASMVLVIERGIAAGKAAWQVHYPRMIVLLLFGLAHFYLLWWGDILANYALVGMIAFVFWRLPARMLVLASAVALSLMYVPMTVIGIEEASTGRVEKREHPPAAEIAEAKAAHATPAAHFRSIVSGPEALRPFESVPRYGLETLGLMLLGMAGYKSGFLTGAWSRRRYGQIAAFSSARACCGSVRPAGAFLPPTSPPPRSSRGARCSCSRCIRSQQWATPPWRSSRSAMAGRSPRGSPRSGAPRSPTTSVRR